MHSYRIIHANCFLSDDENLLNNSIQALIFRAQTKNSILIITWILFSFLIYFYFSLILILNISLKKDTIFSFHFYYNHNAGEVT